MVCRMRHSRYETRKPPRKRLTPTPPLSSAKKHKTSYAWPTARISFQEPILDGLWLISALAVTDTPLKASNQGAGALGRSRLSDTASVSNSHWL